MAHKHARDYEHGNSSGLLTLLRKGVKSWPAGEHAKAAHAVESARPTKGVFQLTLSSCQVRAGICVWDSENTERARARRRLSGCTTCTM